MLTTLIVIPFIGSLVLLPMNDTTAAGVDRVKKVALVVSLIVFILSLLCAGAQKILWFGFFLSFAVKTPLVPFHVWLPRAHAEAPVGGSMLLASVFLKLATYGFLRILVGMMPDATSYFSPLVQTIAVITVIYSSLATLRQSDFKALVAYSSISHMAIVVLGVFSNTIIGIEGAIALSVAHGVVSPALFVLVGSMTLSLVLFLIGILGFIMNRKNIILMIISIEIMLLAVTLLVLVSSYNFDDIMGQTYSIYIITIAGAESAIGLGILVAYYRLRGNISLRT
ncbi:NADH dehydrogenase subunit 4 [Rhizopus azygosporus]|uniref:NADH dehydrogenase subunit 4 n=2 Tax=Fungi TaxID=4751 RepID=A0A367IZW3_RHIAZ|nr:NADH dehydrogenase subunit 4 [Rhizopus azygosporus]